MVIFRRLFILFSCLISLQSHAGLEQFCLVLEGIPLPFCKYTRFHVCNSGFAERCVYNKVELTIKRVDDPSTGKCADNTPICTTEIVPGEGSGTVVRHCRCTDPSPVPTVCRTTCDRCITDNTPSVDLGIECQHFCGDPTKCPGTVEKNGMTLQLSGVTVQLCSQSGLCSPGSVESPGPKSIAECDPLTPPVSSPPRFDASCCYRGGDGAEPYNPAYGVPKCPGTP